ncbi:acyl-protein synthetase [Pseudoalteromonas sp. CO348]|uniref:LuxE/PaaK family acyltransferase n=1 Tax=unclassified Pseudoalteromonas TaxID=194690 RepID=UPI0010239815|nr:MULTISPECIES: acyl-protein synthetase [unclassified Pseudoalteromonas]MCG7538273.1 acyl-protein synthetase [Pseudoalteromonas sp. OF7H-1]RZG08265.1 acyl-protein synthetase [Pseudoalteromonas sp. CO348]
MSYEVDEVILSDWPPYAWPKQQKQSVLISKLAELDQLHLSQCPPFAKLKQSMPSIDLNSHPFSPFFPLPVRLFKSQELKSVPQESVIKTMMSSGTSGQSVSKIYLDKRTSALQVKILSKLVTHLIGKQRLPMLVIDCPSTVKNRTKFSARTAGILGFSMYGRDITYALNDDMTINFDALNAFIDKYQGQKKFIFGFTYIVWLHFVEALEQLSKKIDLSESILLHGGGWKKIEANKVTKSHFKSRLANVTAIQSVHNYYGMIEQTGSIFMECKQGHFHCSSWSEVIIRDFKTLQPVKDGNLGLIQLISALPHSYPGHSILSEDIGVKLGEDDCQCGWKGTYFDVLGRVKQAEVRGCSDTYSK